MMMMMIMMMKMMMIMMMMIIMMVIMIITMTMIMMMITPAEAVGCVLETHKNVTDFVKAVKSKMGDDQQTENQEDDEHQVRRRPKADGKGTVT